jgi:integrase/recombinase XerD
MTPLRALMHDQMTLRHLSERTKHLYETSVANLAGFYHQSPDHLSQDQVQQYLLHLIEERQLSWSSCNIAVSAFRFFYREVLKQPETVFSIPPRKTSKTIPHILSIEEVLRLITAPANPKHRALLMTVYGAGLRVSEAVRLQVRDIVSSRMQIRVEQGKGNKDRYTSLPPRLLAELRFYWRLCRPDTWLFPGRDPGRHLSRGAAQKIYYRAKDLAGITRPGGIHILRHCFATHYLETGGDIFTLKRILGHNAINSTTRYLHLLPSNLPEGKSPLDLLPVP